MLHSPNPHGLAKSTVLGRDSGLSPAAWLPSRLLHWLPFSLVQPLAIGGDFFVILTTSILAGVSYHWIFLNSVGEVSTFIALGLLVSANFCMLLGTQQNYLPSNLVNITRQVRYVTLNWLVIIALLTLVAFALKISAELSRGATLSFFVIGWVSLITFRVFLARTLTQALQSGAFSQQKYILIIEEGQSPTSFALDELYRCGYRPAQIVEVGLSELQSNSKHAPLVKQVRDLATASQTVPVDCIFLMMKWARSQEIGNLLHVLRALPLPVYLLPDEHVATFLTGRHETLGSAIAVPLQRPPLTAVEQGIKRGLDMVIAAMLIVALAPLMLLTAMLIKLDSRGPLIFRQRRLGFAGSAFSIYKFRTMHVLEDGNCIVQARRNDPRVTLIGRWLRQTSIDELPQLFNVLKGEMSLVGPRPHAVAHDDEYQEVVANYAFRQHVKPGITGWAQINGFRGETTSIESMARRIEHDLWYINHWNLWLDLKILVKTLFVALRQPMAY